MLLRMTSGLLVVMFGTAVVIGNSDTTENNGRDQNLVAQFIAASGGAEFGSYETAQADQQPAKAPLMSAQAATAETNASIAEHSFDEDKLVMVSFSTKAVPPKPEANDGEAKIIKASATPEPAAAELFTVTGSRVNLRAGPSTGNPVIGKLMEGEQVELIDNATKGWAQIRVEGETIGYMSSNFLKPSA